MLVCGSIRILAVRVIVSTIAITAGVSTIAIVSISVQLKGASDQRNSTRSAAIVNIGLDVALGDTAAATDEFFRFFYLLLLKVSSARVDDGVTPSSNISISFHRSTQ